MKKHITASNKARIALEALTGIKTTAQIASEYSVHPVQVGMWKKKLSGEARMIFDTEHSDAKQIKVLTEQVNELHRLVGVREAELDWLKKKIGP